MAQPHVVLDTSVVNHVRVVVQDDLCRYVVELLLSFFVLRLLVVSDSGQCATMTDDLWDTTVCRHVCALGLLR